MSFPRRQSMPPLMAAPIFHMLNMLILILALGGSVEAKSSSSKAPTPPLWLSDGTETKISQMVKLQQKAVTVNASNGSLGSNSLVLQRASAYQTFEGVGGALTESSAIVLSNLSDSNRKKALELLFDPDSGIGLTQLRYPAGPTDFSLDFNATYMDDQDGSFSLAMDQTYRIPVLQQILKINPDVNISSSPWTPPAWMKDSKSTCAGKLLTSRYQDYADYLVNFIQSYAALGINISAISPQNEPLAVTTSYPTTDWDGDTEGKFINDYLGPAIEKAGNVSTAIWAFDDNYDNTTFPTQVLDAASKYVSNIAFHCYVGYPSEMSSFLSNASVKHPDLKVHLSECSGGTWSGGNFSGMAFATLSALANNASTAMLWNLALNPGGGPTLSGNTTSQGLLNVTQDSFTPTGQFQVLAHLSKFIKPGAVRIGLEFDKDNDNPSNASILATAWLNPDNTTAVVAFNRDEDAVLTVRDTDWDYAFQLPTMSMATLGIGMEGKDFQITAGAGALGRSVGMALLVAGVVGVLLAV